MTSFDRPPRPRVPPDWSRSRGGPSLDTRQLFVARAFELRRQVESARVEYDAGRWRQVLNLLAPQSGRTAPRSAHQDHSSTEQGQQLPLLEAEAFTLRGGALLRTGQEPDALDEFHEAVRLFATERDRGARFMARELSTYGLALLHVGERANAIQLMEDAIGRPGAAVPEVYHHLGSWYLEYDRSRAAELLTEAVEQMPHDARVRLDLAALLESEGQTEEALVQYIAAADRSIEAGDTKNASLAVEGALALSPKDLYALMTKAEIGRVTGSLEIALTCLDRIEELAPSGSYEHTWALTRRAIINLDRAPASAIAEQVNLILSSDPEPSLAVVAGQLQFAIGEKEEAVATLRNAIEEDPTMTWARSVLASALVEIGWSEQALAQLDEAIRFEPDYWPALMTKGQILMTRGDFREAAVLFQEAAAVSPDPAAPFSELAEAYRRMGKPGAALRAIDQAIALDAEDAWIAGTKGQILLALDRTQEGIEALEYAASLEPEMTWVLDDLGRALLRLGETERVRSIANQIISDASADQIARASALALLAAVGLIENNPEEAADFASQSLAAEGSDLYLARAIRGSALRQLGRIEEAIQDLERAAVSSDVVPVWVYGELARALLDVNRHQDAGQWAQNSVEVEPGYADGYALLGEVSLAAERFEEAMPHLARAAELDPDAPAPYFTLAYALHNLGRNPEALEAVDRGLALDDRDLRAWLIKGEVLVAEGRFSDAAVAFQRAIELDPETSWQYGELALALLNDARPDEAVEILERRLQEDPEYSFGYLVMSRALTVLGDEEGALESALRAGEADPNYTQAFAIAAQLLAEQGQPEAALDMAERALAISPDIVETLERKLDLLHLLGRPSEAIEPALAVIDSVPEEAKARAYADLALVYRGAGRLDDALEAIDASLRGDPENAYSLGVKGATLRSQDDIEAAITFLNRSLEHDKNLIWIYGELASALRDLDRLEEALEICDIVLEKAPDYAFGLATRSQVLRLLGRTGDALEAIDSAIDVDPTSAWLHVERAEVLRVIGRNDDALSAAEAGLALDDDYAWGWATKGSILRDLAAFDASEEAYRKAIELDRTVEWAFTELCDLLVETGAYDEALVVIEQGLSSNPDSRADMLFAKARTLAAMGREDRAEKLLDTMVEDSPDDQFVLTTAAALHRASDRYDAAFGLLVQALEHGSASPEALSETGLWLTDAGAFEVAAEFLTEAAATLASAEVYAGLAWAHENAMQGEEALEAWDATINLEQDEENRLWAVKGRAEALTLLGKKRKAASDYRAVLDRIDPSHVWLLPLRGWCEYRLGEYLPAVNTLTDALSLDVLDVSGKFDLALFLLSAEQYSLGAREYRRALGEARKVAPFRRHAILRVAHQDLAEAMTSGNVRAEESLEVKASIAAAQDAIANDVNERAQRLRALLPSDGGH